MVLKRKIIIFFSVGVLSRMTFFVRGDFFIFFPMLIFNTALPAATQIPLCFVGARRCLGSNPGQLRIRHLLSDHSSRSHSTCYSTCWKCWTPIYIVMRSTITDFQLTGAELLKVHGHEIVYILDILKFNSLQFFSVKYEFVYPIFFWNSVNIAEAYFHSACTQQEKIIFYVSQLRNGLFIIDVKQLWRFFCSFHLNFVPLRESEADFFATNFQKSQFLSLRRVIPSLH